MIKKIVVLGAIVGSVFLFSACGKAVVIKGNAPVTELNPDSTQPRHTPTARAIRGRQTAVRHLMGSARRQVSAGRFSTAAELLERGIRIDPYNAELWSNLANVRFKQKNYRLAESLAHKSNSFAENNRVLKLKNWRLIAESRSLRGDAAGAADASGKVRTLMR